MVVKKLGEVTYLCQRNKAADPVAFHVDHLKLYHSKTLRSWLPANGGGTRDFGVQCGDGDATDGCESDDSCQSNLPPRRRSARQRKAPQRLGWSDESDA